MASVAACIPVTLTNEERLWEEGAKVKMPAPYPDSVQRSCMDCGRGVWVGPRQQLALDIDAGILTCCFFCAAKLVRAQEDSGVQFINLENPHKEN